MRKKNVTDEIVADVIGGLDQIAAHVRGEETSMVFHAIETADDDDPKLTDEQLAQMRPAREVMTPEEFAAVTGRPIAKPSRGRPKADEKKVAVSLRLDKDVVDAFKATGAGWQTRVNAILVRAASRLPK